MEDIKGFERLPCSSILVRIYEAPRALKTLHVLSIKNIKQKDWEKSGVWHKDVPYYSGAFVNEGMEVRQSELELFKYKQ